MIHHFFELVFRNALTDKAFAAAELAVIPLAVLEFLWVGEIIHQIPEQNLNRPGGNITGMSIFPSEVAAKTAQLLKELLPAATRHEPDPVWVDGGRENYRNCLGRCLGRKRRGRPTCCKEHGHSEFNEFSGQRR